MEAPPTSQVTTGFVDWDSIATEVSAEASDVELEALHSLSDNLAAAFRSPDDFEFLADARVVVPGAPDLHVHRCVLARSPFLRAVFARRAAAATGSSPGADGVRLELRELLGEEVEVGYEAMQLVLDYLYSGRIISDLPKSACACVDEDDCSHVGCHPAVSFMVQVLFAAWSFQVVELINLFQVRISPSPAPVAMIYSSQTFIAPCWDAYLLDYAFYAAKQLLVSSNAIFSFLRARMLAYAATWEDRLLLCYYFFSFSISRK
jgi:hypothetical protein